MSAFGWQKKAYVITIEIYDHGGEEQAHYIMYDLCGGSVTAMLVTYTHSLVDLPNGG